MLKAVCKDQMVELKKKKSTIAAIFRGYQKKVAKFRD